MATVTIEVAQARLPELIEALQPGETLTINRDGQPCARLQKSDKATWPGKAGSYRKPEFWMAPDFNTPLDDFKDYME